VGECSGLNVGDVNLLIDRQVSVSRTRMRVKGGWEVHVPKNGRPRQVPILPSWLQVDMAAYLAAHAHADDADAPLFPGSAQARTQGETGGQNRPDYSKPWEPGVFRRRMFARALRDAGLPARTRLHDLRHTAASLMMAHGVEPFAAAEYLGHSVQVFQTTYAHLYPSAVARHSALFAAIRPEPASTNVTPLHRSA
jgi:integrase